MSDDKRINLNYDLGNPFNLDEITLIQKTKENSSFSNKNQVTKKTDNSETKDSFDFKIDESALIKELTNLADQATEQIKEKEQFRIKTEITKQHTKETNKFIVIGAIIVFVVCFSFVFTDIGKSHRRAKRTPYNVARPSDNEFSNGTATGSSYNTYYNQDNFTYSNNINTAQAGFESNPM